jgi:hypothetical protein
MLELTIAITLLLFGSLALTLAYKLYRKVLVYKEYARSIISDLLQAKRSVEASIDTLRRSIGVLDYKNRPQVRSRIQLLTGRCAKQKSERPYSLDQLVRSIDLNHKVAAASGEQIAICSLALGESFQAAILPCIESHEQFARKRGYGYVLLDKPPPFMLRPPAWMKIPLITKLLSQGKKYICFIDADAMVTNYERAIESYFKILEDNDACILLTEDDGGINTGVMFVRNCIETLALLDLIWMYDADVTNPTWEQFALKMIMEDFPEVCSRLLVDPDQRNFNSFPVERSLFHATSPQAIWSLGDFICHFSGIRQPHLSSFIERYARSLGTPPTIITAPSVASLTPKTPVTFDRPTGTVTFSKLGDWGEFGNQLFQISVSLGYAAHHKAKVMLPHWRCRRGEVDYGTAFPRISKYYGSPPASTLYTEPNFTYSQIPFQPHIDLRGNFQSERYFAHVRDEVVTLFSEPTWITPKLDAYCREHGFVNFDAMHFRTYGRSAHDQPSVMAQLPESYFLAAMAELSASEPLVIATDNKPFVLDFLHRHSISRPVHILTFADSMLDFYMLSRANRIAISNSSFSWWAAYLGKSKDTVIAPHRYFWFSGEARKDPFWDPRDLYPDNFHELVF